MYFVDNGSAVPVMPQVKPVSSATPQFFTEGGNGTPPTYPGPDWFNIFQLELLNVLKEAQINPDKANHTQLVTAMKKLFLDASSNGSDIPDKAAFLSNLGLDTALNNKQPLDSTLTALAALAGAADSLPYFTGPDAVTLTPLKRVGRDIIAAESKVDVRNYLDLSAVATLDVGTAANTVAAGNDSRFSEMLGVGQAWQDMLSARNINVVYTNTTGRPISILVAGQGNGSSVAIQVNGVTSGYGQGNVENGVAAANTIVPVGAQYIVSGVNLVILSTWSELR